MSDAMMRVAGRGKDGTAKAISTENNGHLNVKVNCKSNTLSNITINAGEIIEVARFFKEGYGEFLITANINGNDLAKDIEFIVQGHRVPDSDLTPLESVDFKPFSNLISQRNDGSLGFIYSDLYALIDKTSVSTWSEAVSRIKYMENYLPIHGQVWRILAHNKATSERTITRIEVAVR